MRVASQNTADLDLGRFDLGHGCTRAEYFSAMWTYAAPDAVLPFYGPQMVGRTLDVADLRQAALVLVETVREICIYETIRSYRRAVELHTIPSREGELERIADRFYLNGREAVCDFLRQHRFLIPILIEVSHKFVEYFGIINNQRPRLEVFTDPEDNHSAPKLFALVLTTLSSDDASTRLGRLDEEWWLNQPSEVRRVLNIDVDYIDGV